MQSRDNLPSNKVGVALLIVVLIVVGTIFGSQFEWKKNSEQPLQNIELVLERKTDGGFKTGDEDEDGLPDWLEDFYKTDSKNPDSDGDGTNDGEEVQNKRDPAVAGPNDPLVTYRDRLQTEADLSDFTPGTLTDQVSVDLFQQYILLKKQGALSKEDEQKMLEQISQKAVAESSLVDQYSLQDLKIVPSTKESITAYAERYAQIAIDIFLEMNAHKNLEGVAYFKKIGELYRSYTDQVLAMSVPDVFKDVHVPLINQLNKTSIFFEKISNTDADPVTSLVVTAQFQASQVGEQQLYTTLANYFKNNAIIFDTDSTRNFWKQFEN